LADRSKIRVNRTRWLAIEDLFHRALSQPAERREAWVRDACGGDPRLEEPLLEMLAEDEGTDDDIVEAVSDVASQRLKEMGRALERLRTWRVLRLIGSGGMGAVYLASRDASEFEKTAAIKVLHQGVNAPPTSSWSTWMANRWWNTAASCQSKSAAACSSWSAMPWLTPTNG
jgi:serine/threonine protein kinase